MDAIHVILAIAAATFAAAVTFGKANAAPMDPAANNAANFAEPLSLPPAQNGPAGDVWIDLSEPTYGIHGTPHPSKIGKTSSHGCVRMTNWDAGELAHMVSQGVTVEFRD